MPTLPSPPRGTTRTSTVAGPPVARRRAVRRRDPPDRVARRLGVSCEAVSKWHAAWQTDGTGALRSRGPSGPSPTLSDQQLARVEQALLEGATANGLTGGLWTLDRIATVIERLTGARHHPAHVWALLRHRLGWSVQRPKRRAAERDQAAIDRWVAARWPRILQTPNGAEPAWSSSTKARSA
jgi:transposase